MTNLSNSCKNSNSLKASARFAANQLLAEHYPNISKVFKDLDLINRLEYGTHQFGLEWLRCRLYGSDTDFEMDQFPEIRSAASQEFFQKLNDILDDPKAYYEALRDLLCGFDSTDFAPLMVNSMTYMTESLRSLLLEAHINQVRR